MNTMETQIAGDERSAPGRALVKPLLILFIVAAIVLGGIFSWQQFVGKMTKHFMGTMATAPQTISTTVAAATQWQARTQALGTVRAVRGADLAAQASGVVEKIHIDSGTEVKAGTLLLALKANDDPAKLAQLEAATEIAEINYKRDQQELVAEAISQSTADTDLSTLKSARAQVAAQRALIEEKMVRAPFAGRLGIRQVDEGQYLAAGTPIVTLQALDSVFVDFYVPQQALAALTLGSAVRARIDTYPDQTFVGTVASINSKIDSSSRNVQVRAAFPNADRKLLPGMYANVEIETGAGKTEITLPQSAITFNSFGDTVFLVQQNNTVLQRFVKLGDRRGDQIAVVSGVEAGDVVVTSGQMKLRNGAPIVVNNKIQPADSPVPTPPNE